MAARRIHTRSDGQAMSGHRPGRDIGAGRAGSGPLVLGGRTIAPGDPLGPWTFVRELGAGGTARVLLVTNEAGTPFALKVLHAERPPTAEARLRREFRALARIEHPNVVRVFARDEVHGHPCIAMEYVDGPDLHQVLDELSRRPPAERWSRVEAILVDLCRALTALHRRGLVHRDLKPSNVLLTRDGRCKLTDFGIVKVLDAAPDPELSTTIVGTWAYCAPEHISGDRVDHRSDLYSLGVLLFALLTGRRPFEADSMAGYLTAHRERPPPRPSSFVPDVPPHLEEVCLRLLQKHPKDRFQTAQEILWRLEVECPEPADLGAWEPPLVGRVEALVSVEAAVDALADGRGGLVLVLADDGLGRSRLLEHAGQRAEALGLHVHRVDFDPDEPVFGAAAALSRALVEARPEATGDLRDVLATWSAGVLPRGDTRYALHDGLRAALSHAADETPTVLLLDDLHEAQPPELDLLRFVTRQVVLSGRPVLVVAAGRPTPDLAPEAWRLGSKPVRVSLPPLDETGVAEILTSFLGPGRAAAILARRVHRESEGSPWYVVELLRAWAAQGLVIWSGVERRLAVAPAELAEAHLEVPPGIRQVLRRRIAAVAPSDREVLDALAVGGRSCDVEVLVDVLDQEEEALRPSLARLSAAGLLRERRGSDRVVYEIVHRQLLELLRSELDPERAQLLHGAFATALTEAGGVAPDPETLERIGEHHRLAGDAGRAYALLVTAAHRLTELAMPEQAGRLAERAASIQDAALDALPADQGAMFRRLLLRARGESLRNRGDWAGAARAYRELVDLAARQADERLLCDARVQLAHALRRTGESTAATAVARAALTAARRLHYRKGVADALHALSGLAWAAGDADQCEALADEGLLLCEGPSLAAERAVLLMSRSAAQAHKGQLAWALRGTAEAERLFHELSMKPLRVLSLANLSELHLWQGEAHPAWSRADEAVEIGQAVGFRLGTAAALRARGMASAVLGRYGSAQADLLESQRLGREIGVDELVLAASVALVSLALEQHDVLGAARYGVVGLEAARSCDPEDHLPLLQALLARALARSRTSVAWALLQAAEDALPSLPTPRRLPVLLATAWAWYALGDKARAQTLARDLVRDGSARAFRLLNLEARALLALTTAGEEARRHRQFGAELVQEFTAGLPIALAEEARRRPILRVFAEG